MFRIISAIFFINSVHGSIPEQCTYMDYVDKEFNIAEVGCPYNSICNTSRVINLRYIDIHPYFYEKMKNEEAGLWKPHQKPVHQLIRRCCGSCANISQLQVLRNIAELTPATLKGSDFVYPVLSTASKQRMYGYHYIPLVDIPDMMLMSEPPKADLKTLFLNVFPICLVCLLLCFVAGFVCWLLETWKNEEEFPREFLIGWFEGFWWAFISMTTVGYGDKAPKTYIGRIYSMGWITIGIIAYGTLTGIVYTEVTKVNSPPPCDMRGKRIGTLRFRDYDAMVVLKSGGLSVRYNDNNVTLLNPYAELLSLVVRLRNKDIDGYAIDQFTLNYAFRVTKHYKEGTVKKDPAIAKLLTTDLIEYFDKLVAVKVPYVSSESFTYGILVKRKEDHQYFKDAAESLRQTIQRVWTEKLRLTTIEDPTLLYSAKEELFSYSGKYFLRTAIGVAVIGAVICVLGVLYEMARRGKCGDLKRRSDFV